MKNLIFEAKNEINRHEFIFGFSNSFKIGTFDALRNHGNPEKLIALWVKKNRLQKPAKG
ncbi:hypothetical protein [Chryseobacterium sp. Marseille-Q3244]|uniref:hypothetical protein n=1 Tax=Chryseobacterium sp. Marseille-Q3244 TaxID=2758092 RepID=UPI0020243E3E|nr:hypothetical protein [Chryseobacterium sp. Marseille-Q3244]